VIGTIPIVGTIMRKRLRIVKQEKVKKFYTVIFFGGAVVPVVEFRVL
jgi:hypothetical protein